MAGRAKALSAALAGCILITAAQGCSGQQDGPVATVLSFNAAITRRDQGAAIGLLAEDGVLFQLRAAHPGLGAAAPALTTELAGNWRSVSAILFAGTVRYSRSVDIVSVETHGDWSTVWVDVHTESQANDANDVSEDRFSEFYLLKRGEAGWRIAAMGNNRARPR